MRKEAIKKEEIAIPSSKAMEGYYNEIKQRK